MQLSFATHFFQSLSFALVNSIWQVALLWLFFLIVFNNREINPQKKYIFLVIAQIIGFVWFVQTFFSAFYFSQSVETIFNLSNNQVSTINQILFFIGILYLVVVVYQFILFLAGIKSIQNITNKNIENYLIDFDLFVDEMSKSLGITIDVIIKVSTKITTPLTIGVLKPIILIPIASINALTTSQLEAIILHELAHIKRKDYLINLMLLGIDLFMFFNPFSKAIKKQIFFERELCCDDVVLQHQYPKGLYAEALVTIAAIQSQKTHSTFTLNAVSTNKDLLRRVQRIFGIKHAVQNNLNKIFTSTIVLIIGLIALNITTKLPEKKLITANQIAPNKMVKSIVVNNENIIKKPDVASTKKEKSFRSKQVNEEFKQTVDLKNDLVETLNYFKPIENNPSLFAYQNIDDENLIKSAIAEEPIVVTSAVNKYPIITSQKFFIPPTSSKPASIIIVTTTEKEAGKKIVQIEIVKGTGTVE